MKMKKMATVLLLVAIIFATGCVSKEELGITPSSVNAGQEIETGVYYAIDSVPSTELESGVILSNVRLDGNYIIAFLQNNKTETADVSSVRASFEDANGNHIKDVIPEYYAGINDWGGAIVGWQVQKIQPQTKWKIRISVPDQAVKVIFYG